MGKVTTLQIAWVAGILDGEGCFAYDRKPRHGGRPRIILEMTDFDTIQKYASITGATVFGPYQKPARKPTLAAHLYQTKAVEWMMTVYTFLSTRRQEKVREVLTTWRSY